MENGIKWPEWMSIQDQKLLESSSSEAAADVVVAVDGSGNYKTVSEAVEAAPSKNSKRYIIKIKAGVYRENVDVPSSKRNIMFWGDGRSNTIITAYRSHGSGWSTFNSATVGNVTKPPLFFTDPHKSAMQLNYVRLVLLKAKLC